MLFYAPLALIFVDVVLAVSDEADDIAEAGSVMSDEKRLIKHLLVNYERVGLVGRPVYNQSDTIRVNYGLALIQILDLDEKNQVLTTNIWSRYEWNDILLAWDPSKFGGVDEIRVPPNKIWTPDIVLYNYADFRLKEQREAMIIVKHTGTVYWMPPAIFMSTCPIDITNFPFDVQTCKMKFGSWTYDGTKLDINFIGNSSVEIGDYTESNEWYLVGQPAKKNIKYYTGLDTPYPDLTFYIQLQRIAIFYKYILVLPCVLLSFLTLVIFWLPPESPAKVMLGMSVFVAFFVLLLLLADSTPPAASDIPLIGAYFCMNMILITLSTFLAVIIIQTHIRGDRKNKVPPWLKRIAIDGMARILCMSEFIDKDPAKQTQSTNPGARSTSRALTVADCPTPSTRSLSRPSYASTRNPSEMNYGSRIQPSSCLITAGMPPSASASVNGGGGGGGDGSAADRSPVHCPSGNPALEGDIREIRKLLKIYISRLEIKDAAAKATKEWRIVARVLDRLFFFCYIGTIIVSLFTVFPRDTFDPKTLPLPWAAETTTVVTGLASDDLSVYG